MLPIWFDSNTANTRIAPREYFPINPIYPSATPSLAGSQSAPPTAKNLFAEKVVRQVFTIIFLPAFNRLTDVS